MSRRNLLIAGSIGALVAALCCSTPLLVLLLGAVGLSALTGAIDYVAIPALVIFIGIIIYALWQRRSASSCNRRSLARRAAIRRPSKCRRTPAGTSTNARDAAKG
jgi:mercuric ion transport protein